MPFDVFISHAPEDQTVAEQTCEFLEGQGVACWLPARDSTTAESFAEEGFSKSIKDCSAVVLIFSKSADACETVRRQAELAVRFEKLLIPFLIENIRPGEAMEPFFRRRYWHDAHTPPLRRHLEELARLLRPLTMARVTESAEEALLSRTLPSRASVVRSNASVVMPLSREPSGPVRVSLNFDHVIIAGCLSSFELLIRNVGLENLDDVEVVLESRSLSRDVVQRWPSVTANDLRRTRLELETMHSEQSVLHVIVKCRAGGRQLVFSGSRALTIFAAPSAERLTSGTYRLTEAIPNAGAFAGGAADFDIAAERKFESVPDLLNFALPENFEPVPMVFDYEIGTGILEAAASPRPLRIPANLLGLARPGSRLVLEPLPSTATKPHQAIRMVARTTFNLGRSPEESDFLLWFWPRDEVHDTKTRRLSKRHCSLSSETGQIYVCNTASASLTTFDGQDVTAAQGVPLKQRGILNLSSIYFLDVIRFPPAFTKGPTITNLDSWIGKTSRPEPSPVRGSVRMVPLTPHVLTQHAIWLLSDATFGKNPANPIMLDLPGLGEMQGRFYHHLGCFWIESFLGDGAVQIDDEVAAPGLILPLADGQKVKLGERRFHATITP